MIPPIGGWQERADSRPVVIGLTGPIGCGKSTVASMLGDVGGVVIDADELAREATRPGSATLPEIRQRFGESVFQGDGSLNRAALAEIVFADPVALRDLERIIHPAVHALIEDRLEAANRERVPFCVVEAIKLVEAGLADRCNEVWLVTCGEATRRRRLQGRGASQDDVERRLAAQGPDLAASLARQLEGHALVRTLSTEGTLSETRDLVEEWLAVALDRPRAR